MPGPRKISACPSWLALREDRLGFVYQTERAEVVKKIFKLAIGGIGAYAIAQLLDKEGIRPFGSSATWDHSAIDSMLRNRATVGEYQPKSFANGAKRGVPTGSPVPNYYPAVIDEATFQAAQAARRQNLTSRRSARGRNLANIFDGLATCAYCGNELKSLSNSDNTRSLVCSRDMDSEGCTRTAWSYSDFEANVLQFLAHPALVAMLDGEKRESLSGLVSDIKVLAVNDVYAARCNIAIALERVVTKLNVASAGAKPVPRTSNTKIRRNISGRYYDIRLWDGPILRGLAVD